MIAFLMFFLASLAYAWGFRNSLFDYLKKNYSNCNTHSNRDLENVRGNTVLVILSPSDFH